MVAVQQSKLVWHVVPVLNGWRAWCSDGTPGDPAQPDRLAIEREVQRRNEASQ